MGDELNIKIPVVFDTSGLLKQLKSLEKNHKVNIPIKLDMSAGIPSIDKEVKSIQLKLSNSVAKIKSELQNGKWDGSFKMSSTNTVLPQYKKALEDIRVAANKMPGLIKEKDIAKAKELVSEYNKLKDLYARLNNQEKLLKAPANSEKGWETLSNKYYKFQNQYGSVMSRSPEMLNKFNEFGERLQNLNFANINEADAEFRALTATIERTGLTVETAGQKLKRLFGDHFKTAVVMLAIAEIQKGLRDVITSVEDLDKCVVNLSMVTGKNRGQTKELLTTYSEMAKTLGATTTDVASAADDWLRQGYTLEDTNKLIETSMVLSKVGQLESAEATKYLTSALKGYKVEIADAMSIVDKMSSVDMAAAVSTAGLAEAMAKTANSARIAGISMDRLLGYIAATAEVSQADASTVGTSYKTIFARLSNIKLGRLKDEDGENITQPLSDAEQVLDRVGIKLRKTATEFNDFDAVFDQIGSRWTEFNDIEQSTIATALGGTRQKEQVITLFENYGNALKYAGISADSAGSSMKKFNAYKEGVEDSLQKFTATFEALSSNALNSDFVKGTVDTGSGFLGAISWVIENLGSIPTLVGVAAAALSAKNVGWPKKTGDNNMPIHIKEAA